MNISTVCLEHTVWLKPRKRPELTESERPLESSEYLGLQAEALEATARWKKEIDDHQRDEFCQLRRQYWIARIPASIQRMSEAARVVVVPYFLEECLTTA